MALATLDGLVFRINPSAISWNFSIKTHVEETIGGRVVQVLGATLSDIALAGEYGERKGIKGRRGGELAGDAGQSWRLAEEFVRQIKMRMEKQSADSREHDKMNPPLLFEFPDYGWRFRVYIKGIATQESDSAITHTTGTFAYKYRLSLFVVEDVSDNLTRAGSPLQETKGVINQRRQAAINAYIARISAGVGWKRSEFNNPVMIQEAVTGPVAPTTSTTTGTSPRTSTRGGVQE